MQTTYQICNLSCPNCAGKIENALKKEMNVDDVTINLAAGQITLRHQEPLSQDFIDKASQIALAIEEGVFLQDLPDGTDTDSEHDSPITTTDKALLASAVLFFGIGLFLSNETYEIAALSEAFFLK